MIFDGAASPPVESAEVAGPPLSDVVPPPLRAIMDARYDYDDGRGVTFEPYMELEPVAETAWWLRHWTGNPDVTGEGFRPFGSDGGGGYVCSWMIRGGADLVDQPVVYLGSDGDVVVLAADAWTRCGSSPTGSDRTMFRVSSSRGSVASHPNRTGSCNHTSSSARPPTGSHRDAVGRWSGSSQRHAGRPARPACLGR